MSKGANEIGVAFGSPASAALRTAYRRAETALFIKQRLFGGKREGNLAVEALARRSIREMLFPHVDVVPLWPIRPQQIWEPNLSMQIQPLSQGPDVE